MMKRRSFLTYFGLSWLASSFPIVLAACAPKSSIQEPTANAETAADKGKPVAKKAADGFTVVGTVVELDKTGQIQIKDIAVARDPANPQNLVAVNPKCTHSGCTVKWSPGEKRYDCPCHDAEFSAAGKVLKGPAKTSLATYSAKIVGTQVLVKV
jgi:cytochrome b6-f complex iron-sulfur subunit